MTVKEFIERLTEFNQEAIFKIDSYFEYEQVFINNCSLSLGKHLSSTNKVKYLDDALYLSPRYNKKDEDKEITVKELIKGLSWFNQDTIIKFFNINEYDEEELCDDILIFYGGSVINRFKYSSFTTGEEYTNNKEILNVLQNIDYHISKDIEIDYLGECEQEEILEQFAKKVYQDNIVYLQIIPN